MNYAIINKATKEFYPDPIYVDLNRIKNKIAYLRNYKIKNNMKQIDYVIEKLSERRKKQHDKEWAEYVSSID